MGFDRLLKLALTQIKLPEMDQRSYAMNRRAYTTLVIFGVLLIVPVALAALGHSQGLGSPLYLLAMASITLTPIYGVILLVWGVRGLMRKGE